ncbi:CoA-binding protein, partial [bacterium]|nr:CoA-binding protein [bacterium]
ESGKKGKTLQKKIVKLVKKANIPLLGPNCLGVIRPSLRLNASFAPATPGSGEIAFISQSGALIDSVIDMSLLENFGFSYIISYGNEADLSLCDFLLWLKRDQKTKVIILYLEGVKDGKRFIKTAKEVSRVKPILALKAGKTKAGIKAAASHTAALAGSPEIYSAAFRKANIIEVETLQELFDIAKTLAWQPRCANGVGIVTNGGGFGVLITDYCQKLGIKLPRLEKETISKIKNSKAWHPAITLNNPLDILGDALSERYKIAIEAMIRQENIRGLIVIQTLQIMTDVKKNVKIIIEEKKKWPQKPIISVILKGKLSQDAIRLLEKNKIPNFPDLKRAALAMRALIK